MFLAEPEYTPYDLHFTIARVPVRVHWWFWITSLMCVFTPAGGVSIVFGVAVFFISILVHELGHALAMIYFGDAPRIVLYAMGGLATSNGRSALARRPMNQVVISFAGPLAGFILAAIGVCLIYAIGGRVLFFRPTLESPIFWFVDRIENPQLLEICHDWIYINLLWGAVNLLPVFPLDGGQIARQFLIARDPYNGVRLSLQISVVVGTLVAIVCWVYWREMFTAVLFGSLAFSSYQVLQQMGGGYGGRRPW